MESLKRRLSESVQLRLSLVLCVAVGSIAFLSGVLGFLSAWDEAHELQDSSLQQIASLAKDGMLTPGNSSFISPPLQDEEASRIVVHFIMPDAAPAADFPLPTHLDVGFHTLKVNQQSYRVLIENMAGGVHVAVAQRASVQESVALSSALRTLVPFGILFPVLLYLIADLVKKIFRPIRQLAAEVDQQRDSAAMSLNGATIPREIQPFITAINRLLQRSSDAITLQRRFVADAAHELRSPLTALMLQSERLASSELPPESQHRLRDLRAGMERASWLVEQLLTLSRAQSGEAVALPPVERTQVFAVVKQVISDLHPLAEHKAQDLGVLSISDAVVRVRPSDLYTVLRNLLHNAIQYTPEGGCIDMAIEKHHGQVLITVEDSGPGIPADKHTRVFDAFYRMEGNDANGSGLGLSIVHAMLVRMQGEVVLATASRFPSGLKVSVSLPLA
ncbi:sensor histidine kinase [Enterobacter cancerogenus]|uniref:sensor histidine kinase n=1 Tax=Enterobacter cancerogenus TaxID=69218 RepID=UPI000536FDEE|nr:ATP-binding protein [Enterobacter cancerogenus]KGT87481.1 hypothetical protein NH00_21820 [Enterobacter cancerogenus]